MEEYQKRIVTADVCVEGNNDENCLKCGDILCNIKLDKVKK